MQDLIILGTAVHGVEMVEIVERVNDVTPAWNLLGFLATDDAPAGRQIHGTPVLGGPADLSRYPDAYLAPCNEWPASVDVPEDRLATLIDPSCVVSRTASIGAGSVLYPGCFVGLEATLGTRLFALAGCVINHDVRIDDHVVLASGVLVAGGVTVERDAYLGQGCSIRQNLRIGRGSLVGTGAVVVEDVPPHTVVAGNPARRLRDIKPEGE